MNALAVLISLFVLAIGCGGGSDSCPPDPGTTGLRVGDVCSEEGKSCTYPGDANSCTCVNGEWSCRIVEAPLRDLSAGAPDLSSRD